jgi:hypothetical protein
MPDCHGCQCSFKTDNGLIRHLSNKVFCQGIMLGLTVPLVHPAPLKIPMNLQACSAKQNNKKRPAPPQLAHRLKSPPPFQPIKKKVLPNLQAKVLESVAMDSHHLQRQLSGMLVDQGLRYDELQHNAGLSDHDSNVEEKGRCVIGHHYNVEDKEEKAIPSTIPTLSSRTVQPQPLIIPKGSSPILKG